MEFNYESQMAAMSDEKNHVFDPGIKQYNKVNHAWFDPGTIWNAAVVREAAKTCRLFLIRIQDG